MRIPKSLVESYNTWFLGAVAFASIVIGFLAFIPAIKLASDVLLPLIFVALGLLMGAVVALTISREAEIKEIEKSLRLVEIKALEGRKSFPQDLIKSVTDAQEFILDTNLNEKTPTGDADPQAQYRHLLDERVAKGQLRFRKVEIIFTPQRLEKVINRLLLHQGHDYLIKCYDPAPEAIPMLHIMSFDNKVFYLGGFYPDGRPLNERVISIRHPELEPLLEAYWNQLWDNPKAIELNRPEEIYWDQLQKIAKRVGLPQNKFEKLRSQDKTKRRV